jgi:hypothetical protein
MAMTMDQNFLSELFGRKKLPKTEDVLDAIAEELGTADIRTAFKIVGIAVFYSGPRKNLGKRVLENYKNFNRNTAFQTLPSKGTVFDNTDLGVGLALIYQQFIAAYSEAFIPQKGPRSQAKTIRAAVRQADNVMAVVSRAFAESLSGEVETCVCGAGLDRVFYTIELPALMKNPKVTHINGVPMRFFRDVYSSAKPESHYRVFTMICEAEINMIRARSDEAEWKGAKNADALLEDFVLRNRLFEAEQKDTQERLMRRVYRNMAKTKEQIVALEPDRPRKPILPPQQAHKFA